MKHDKDATTMLGPAGVSNSIDASRPIHTAAQPIQVAIKAICSGEFEKALAVAAGMISKAVINKTPTIFIDTAITAAIRTMRIKLTRSGFHPQQLQDHGSRSPQITAARYRGV